MSWLRTEQVGIGGEVVEKLASGWKYYAYSFLRCGLNALGCGNSCLRCGNLHLRCGYSLLRCGHE